MRRERRCDESREEIRGNSRVNQRRVERTSGEDSIGEEMTVAGKSEESREDIRGGSGGDERRVGRRLEESHEEIRREDIRGDSGGDHTRLARRSANHLDH